MDQNGKDDLKTQFVTREGTYRLITLSEYSRPNRVNYQANQNNPQVRVSLITLPPPDANTAAAISAVASITTSATSAANTSLSAAQTVHSNSSAISTTTTVNANAAINSGTSKYLVHQSSLNASNAINATNGTVDASQSTISQSQQPYQQGSSDRICFNFGKELYVYSYRGVKKV